MEHPFPQQTQPAMESPDLRSPGCFEKLVRLHHRELLVYAQALTNDSAAARDIVQEAFITAYQKADAFDVTRDFAAWMRGVVRNKWREWRRANGRYDLADETVALIDRDIAAWQTQKEAGNTPLMLALEDCLTRLPQSMLDVVQACYFEGLSGDEIAERCHIHPAAVRKRLQRARQLLKSCLEQKLSPTK